MIKCKNVLEIQTMKSDKQLSLEGRTTGAISAACRDKLRLMLGLLTYSILISSEHLDKQKKMKLLPCRGFEHFKFFRIIMSAIEINREHLY